MVEALRLRLRRVVLASAIHAGRTLQPVDFRHDSAECGGVDSPTSPVRVAFPGEIPGWVSEVESFCLLVFMLDYLLHLWVSPKPLVDVGSF